MSQDKKKKKSVMKNFWRKKQILFLDYNASLEARNGMLVAACSQSNLKATQRLLSTSDLNVHQQMKDLDTPLMIACRNNKMK